MSTVKLLCNSCNNEKWNVLLEQDKDTKEVSLVIYCDNPKCHKKKKLEDGNFIATMLSFHVDKKDLEPITGLDTLFSDIESNDEEDNILLN